MTEPFAPTDPPTSDHPQLLMHYRNVCIEALGYTLPTEVVTSADLERRLEPLYQRLRLPEGRLELMSGIRERRFWRPGVLPSEKSIESGEKAIRVSGVDRERIGCLIHASVCRDHLEPATACRVHHELRLPRQCAVYDVSNACLGLLNGLLQIANMIELGQIQAGLVVGTEGSRQLVETTIENLNRDESLSRSSIKSAVASLTIGSGSCAILLTDKQISYTGNRLIAAAVRTHSQHHQLCHSGQDEAVGSGMAPLMQTDSETLMREGIAAGAAVLPELLAAAELDRKELGKTFCHQVGAAHRKAMLAALELPLETDFSTLEWLGNTGSVALPLTMAVGLERGHVVPPDRLAMLGIGSGINCIMLAAEWRKSLVASRLDLPIQSPNQSPTPTRHSRARTSRTIA